MSKNYIFIALNEIRGMASGATDHRPKIRLDQVAPPWIRIYSNELLKLLTRTGCTGAVAWANKGILDNG